MKILAVDDDENICALLTEAVAAKTNHELITVASGPEAIRAIARQTTPFDCFLLDIQMPVMDGITLAEKIRKTKGYARTPIIMLTAMSQKRYIDGAFAAGATDYITKPFDFLELFSRIRVADKLVGEQQRVIASASEMTALKRDLIQSTTHSLNEPVEIIGVTQVVGYVAFENYIMQLSRSKLLRSSVFAVKIAGVEKIFNKSDPIIFRQMLTDISSEIVSVLADNGAMAAYRGNGVFLCLLPRNGGFSHVKYELDLNTRLEYCPALRDIETPAKICVGEAFSLRSLTRAGALFSLQKASASAEVRAKSQKEVLALLRKSVRLAPRTGFQTEMERRAYEVLLQDALKEDTTGDGRATAFG
ncbi:MAG: response regulator [Shimia sp.]|jgi:CheY-like chemotaxis protein|uniref:response regulator n=1 Tax=Shimia sp. TaxID=1954381 RepID=UPI00405A2C90